MALTTKVGDLEPGDQALLAQLKGQMEANRKGHDDYVAARSAGDKQGMDLNQPSFNAFEEYASQYRAEAEHLGVTGEPDAQDIPVAVTGTAERNIGKVPAKPDKDA